MTRTQLERTVDSLKAENAALRLRLANRTVQVDLLLQQIDDIKQLLAEHGLEMTYGMDEVDGR